jgi:hypothetical protein
MMLLDGSQFDHLTRHLIAASSRREFVRALGGGGLAALIVGPLGAFDANSKRKHKKRKPKKPKLNAHGCVNVGDACQNGGQCCSGICTGKKSKKTCRAHDTGGCVAGTLSEACGGARVACRTNTGALGHCATTTGNAGYCLMYSFCIACQTDADCQAADGGVLGPTAACIPCADCAETGGTMCATADFLAGMTQEERTVGQ